LKATLKDDRSLTWILITMDIVTSQKQVSDEERAQISQQVKAELIEHLYRGCLPGTIGGIPVGIAFFIIFYGHTSTSLLIAWSIYYSFALLNLGSLYFAYKAYKHKFRLSTWLLAYSIAMSMCALAWGLSTFLIPDDSIFRQYVTIIALLIFANGYAAGTIGVFELCVVTLTIIMIPLVAWCFLKAGPLYKLLGVFTLVYYFFLLGINRRSTQWFKDSLKLKLENTLVSYQANHDLLTNLPNQRLLPQFIDSAINAVKDTKNTFILVCFSLNRMEMINDSLGHQAGDAIIKTVATRFNLLVNDLNKAKDKIQYIITISRKDIFNILLVPLALDEVEAHIKILFSVLDEPFYLEQQGVKVTASIGVSIYGKDGVDAQSLLISADAAMFRAKQYGGNRLELYRAEINEQLPKQLELETDLHAALKNNQLQLYYQPLVDLRTGQISGMEALLRWPHPVLGLISPVRFIPIAEETGLIVPIGEWVLQEACTQTRIWHQMGFTSLKVAVNLAEKQLRQENLIETIKRVLTVTKFDPRFLELEITETAILDESVTSIIKEFKNMGLSLAVDDFGTGYSGLSYLKRFSVEKLKIDQSFIRDIPASNDSITIVSAIIAMAKELKVKTLAEGVETKAQLEFLKSKGCDYMQGYYFSKPLEASFFTQLLLTRQGLPQH
jgi:diguanylate cyclase (GGDEF)-like protein